VTGSVSHHLTTTSTQVDLDLDTLVGNGMIDITFNWGDSTFTGIVLDVYITDQGGVETKVTSGLTIDTPAAIASFEAVKPAGSYELRYELFSNAIKIGGGTEALRIIKDATTSGIIQISMDKQSPSSQGLNINSLITTPVEGTISGLDNSILPNTPVTATFNHLKGGGTTDIDVRWYLDGKLIGSGKTVEFSTYTGIHRLDAVAKTALAGSMGSVSLPFSVSVDGNRGIPVILETIRQGDYDDRSNQFALNQASDCIFLRDGKILVASNNALQLCEVVRDKLQVVSTFTDSGATSNPEIESYPVYGVKWLAADLFDDIVVTVSPAKKTIVIYRYDASSNNLIKLDYRVSNSETDEFWESMSNPVVDPIYNYIYFLDPYESWIVYYSYDLTGMTYIGATFLDYSEEFDSPNQFSISSDDQRTVFVTPMTNSFHIMKNTIGSLYDNPEPCLEFATSIPDGSTASLQGAKIMFQHLYTFEAGGIGHYLKDNSELIWNRATTVDTPIHDVKDMVIDDAFEKGWLISGGSTDCGVSLMNFISGVPQHVSFVPTGNFSAIKIALSPNNSQLCLLGNNSNLMLLRVADD
ncbi:MAG: hypothetical protein PHR58_05200, partial [Sphaerochaetaceae bacterium]|nr:hypothetical protein [Sphaerochaetaceae bacterium]